MCVWAPFLRRGSMGPSHSLCWQLCCKMPPPPPPLSHTLPPKGEENDDDALLLVVDLWLGWGAQEKEEREDVFLPRNFLGVNRREGRERDGRKEKAYESRRSGDLTSSLLREMVACLCCLVPSPTNMGCRKEKEKEKVSESARVPLKNSFPRRSHKGLSSSSAHKEK